jgi:uncharacterized membrane protein
MKTGLALDDEAIALRARRVRQVEVLISTLLRFGVLISLSVVAIGTIVSFARHNDYRSSPEAFTRLISKDAAFPHALTDVFAGVAQGRGQSIVMLGLMLLIATPVIRVAVSIVASAYERDAVYVLITSIVLALLLISFVLGSVVV